MQNAPRPPDPPHPAFALTRLALPFLAMGGLHAASLAADRYWIGGLGTSALAGVGASHAVLGMLTTVVFGLGLGTLAGIGHRQGAGRGSVRARPGWRSGAAPLADRRPAGAARLLLHGLGAALVVGAVVALVAPLVANPLLTTLGATDAARAAGSGYLRLLLMGFVVQAPLTVAVFALQGAGHARGALAVAAIAALGNLALDPILIHGAGISSGGIGGSGLRVIGLGSAGLGIEGAAWATIVSNAFALLAAVWLLRSALHVDRRALRFDRSLVAEVLSVGGPRSVEHLVRNGAGLLLVAVLARYGDAVVAAYAVSIAVLVVLIMPGVAIGQATATLVAKSHGAGKPDRAWRVAWTGALGYAALLGLAGVGLRLYAAGVVRLIDPTPATVAAGADLLGTLAIALPFLGIGLVLGKAFGGARRPLPALASAVVAHLLVQIPLALVLGTAYGPRGAFVAMATAFIVQGTLSAALFWRTFRPTHRPAPTRPQPAVPLEFTLPTLNRASRQPTNRTASGWRRVASVALLVAAALTFSGCKVVDFTEKRELQNPAMRFDDGPTEAHFYQKTFYSREGSAGGIGDSAGGGCGCY